MRAFGPGSISSFLRTVLEVLYVALWTAAGLLALGAIGALLFQPFLGPAPAAGPVAGAPAQNDVEAILRRGPELAAVVAAAALNLAALIVLADRLRRVFASMSAGDPFDPGNVTRLRTIGLALLVLQPAGYVLGMTAAHLLPVAADARLGVSFPQANVSAIFAVLVVFVLAEVFREGARLRAEARLTV